MNKLLFLMALVTVTHIMSMEKEQQPFPFEQLLPELQIEILKESIKAPTVAEAIKNLQNIRLVNKELYNTITLNNVALFKILNALNQRFTGSEGLIARTLNTKLAEEWLKRVNPNASFTIIPTTLEQFKIALQYIKNEDLNSLKKWLDKGYNPKYVQQQTGWTLDSYTVQYAVSVPALQLISTYNPEVFSIKNIKDLLYTTLRGLKFQQNSAIYKAKLSEMADFLTQKLNEQVSHEEAISILNEINRKINKQFTNFD